MKGDLHLHSYYSDGAYSPAEVMARAKAAGCEVVALTDHDTVDGVREATAAAGALGMRNIAGVEFSAYDGAEVHILGYGVQCNSARFCAFIASQKKKREARTTQLLENLAAHGMFVPPERLAGPVSRPVSRVHIAAAMVKLGYARDFHEAVHKWLRQGAPTFVPLTGASPETVIEEIHAAGGKAVLAHPVRLDRDGYARAELVKRLAAAGLDGIEAEYKRSSHAAVKEFKDMARQYGLFVTAGADFHGGENEIIARTLKIPL